MIARLFLVFILIISCALSACQAPDTEAGETPDSTAVDKRPAGPPFLVLRQYNPASDKAHQAFLGFMGERNEAVARTGLAPTEYLVWKVAGTQEGEFGYVVGSLWPSRGTYNAVQDHEAVKAAIARYEKSGLEPFREERASRYVLLNPPSGERPPVPWDRVGHLAMEAHTLDSAEQEAAFIAVLAEGSAAVARAGHPETRYDLWRSAETQKGTHTYLFGSLWADRTAYDAVHKNPEHRAFMERHKDTFEAVLKDGVGNQYERIRLK